MIKDDLLLKFEDGRGIFSFQIKLSERKIQDKDTGYLYCYDAVFGHTGVQEYYARELKMGGNEIVKVHRFAEDVFSDEAMASIKGKSVTNRHPSVAVTSKNYKDLEIGTILDVRREGDNVVGDIVIKDADAIMDILEGRDTALSLGYQAKLIELGNGEYKQTNIIINHLARVPQGRAKNAQIRDENTIEKEKPKMGLFNWLKGLKVKPHDDGSFEILDDDKVEETKKVSEEEKVEDTSHEKEEVVVEKNDVEKHVEEVMAKVGDEKDTETEETKEVKDETKEQENKIESKEENVEMTEEQLKAFKDELRAEMVAEFKAEMKKEKSVFDDVKVVETQDEEKDTKYLTLDFKKDEELRKIYWDKMTNPVAHGRNFKALNAFRERATDLVVR